MRNRNVVYYLSDPAYAPYLLTSAYTLRNFWSGHLVFYCWPRSTAVARAIAGHPSIRASVVVVPECAGHKNLMLNQKIDVLMKDDGTNLLLDADTLVTLPIDDMFELGTGGVNVTQFTDWKMSQGVIQRRLRRLVGRTPEEYEDALDRCLNASIASNYPSVNVGVVAADSRSQVLREWRRYATAVGNVFIADECTMHVLMVHSSRVRCLGGEYNCSPKFAKDSMKPGVRVWHGHGNMWAKPGKCQMAHDMWMQVWSMCSYIGGMDSYAKHCGNSELARVLR